MHRYEITVFWSDEDQLFLAVVPELPGCLAHGDSAQDALASAQDAIALWIETAAEFGDPIPEPASRHPLPA